FRIPVDEGRRAPAGVGGWGMYEFVEPHVRRLVAEHLGVGAEELRAEVSFRDDFAADSLDLVELAMSVESEFAILLPDHILQTLRTYGDLVRAASLLVRAGRARARGAEPPIRVWACTRSPSGGRARAIERTGWLDPYLVELIAEDAVHAGRDVRLDVALATDSTRALVALQHRFAALRKRGIEVTVRLVGDVSAPSDPTAVIARVVLSHPVLDALTGARTTVVLTGYDGDDPWEADDLIALAGEHAKRFGDATPAEQAEASSGGGPCRFVPGDSAGSPYRATMRGHHVHADFDRRRDAAYASRGPAGTATPSRGETPLATRTMAKGARSTSRARRRDSRRRGIRSGATTGSVRASICPARHATASGRTRRGSISAPPPTAAPSCWSSPWRSQERSASRRSRSAAFPSSASTSASSAANQSRCHPRRPVRRRRDHPIPIDRRTRMPSRPSEQGEDRNRPPSQDWTDE